MARPKRQPRSFPGNIIVHVETTLAAGLLVILPLFITIWILKFIFDLVDPVIQTILLTYLPIPHPPGTGVALMLVLLYIAGWFTTHGLGQRMINGVHWLLERGPRRRQHLQPAAHRHADPVQVRGAPLSWSGAGGVSPQGVQVHRPGHFVPGRDRRRRHGGGIRAHHARTLLRGS